MAAPAIEPISLKTLTALELEIATLEKSLAEVSVNLSAHLELTVESHSYVKLKKEEYIKVKKELQTLKTQQTDILKNKNKELSSFKTLNDSNSTLAELISALLDLKRECPHTIKLRSDVFREYMQHLLTFKGTVTYKICDPGCTCCASPTEIEKTLNVDDANHSCCWNGDYLVQRKRAKNWLDHLLKGIFACIPELKAKNALNLCQEDYMTATGLFIKNKFLASGIALPFEEFTETAEFSEWFKSLFVQ